MIEKELFDLIDLIKTRRCEEQTTEVKAAHKGCPEKLYDTISAFSNQDAGGILVFGLDEKKDFEEVGVYDAQDLQKRITEYCEQMTPVVRPVFTVCNKDSVVFVSAEIPPVDTADRPCFKTARGRLNGSYIRVGDADKPMSEYEVYSYEAFKKKIRNDIRPVEEANLQSLDPIRVEEYLLKKTRERPNLAQLSRPQLLELTSITKGPAITMTALLLFGLYPQAYYPQLSILATCIPGTEMGNLDNEGNRFLDTKRIEGTIPDMLESALSFVRTNMRTTTRIDINTGKRTDHPQYPLVAVREAILNAIVHRDYSVHTENKPILLQMYSDRMEISNPGGLYGRLTVNQLGFVQPDTRNPVLVTAMESLGLTENRYSGIPTIKTSMKQYSLPEPTFIDTHEMFKVILKNELNGDDIHLEDFEIVHFRKTSKWEERLLEFCKTPRSRPEIASFIGMPSTQYALQRYLTPLVEQGRILMTIPDKPSSKSQRFVTATVGGNSKNS